MRDSSEVKVNEGVNEIFPDFGVFGGLPIISLKSFEFLFQKDSYHSITSCPARSKARRVIRSARSTGG